MYGMSEVSPERLFDDSIVTYHYPAYGGKTILKAKLGVDKFSCKVPDYTIDSEATKYAADVFYADKNSFGLEVLFVGTLNICNKRQERLIFPIVASTKLETRFMGRQGLERLIFGGEIYNTNRVNTILQSYKDYFERVAAGDYFMRVDYWKDLHV